ncbi:MAG: hypothetical protein ABIG95_01335 [Candidatus Woesearchaeota archaeon]
MQTINRRANLAYNWVEYFFLFLMSIGIVLAFSIKSPNFSYVVIFICGFMSGRLIFKFRDNLVFTLYILLFGFLLGYLLGSYYGNKLIIIVVFIAANIYSYHLHSKGKIQN